MITELQVLAKKANTINMPSAFSLFLETLRLLCFLFFCKIKIKLLNCYCLDLYLGYPYHTDGLTCLAISSDSTLALTGSKDNAVHIVNITTGKV